MRADKGFAKEIDNLGVRCSFCQQGCSWTGVLKELGAHLVDCPHVIVLCPNQCGVEFQRRFVEQHLMHDCEAREMWCTFCQTLVPGGPPGLRQHQDHVCPKIAVSCPNCNKTNLLRGKVLAPLFLSFFRILSFHINLLIPTSCTPFNFSFHFTKIYTYTYILLTHICFKFSLSRFR